MPREVAPVVAWFLWAPIALVVLLGVVALFQFNRMVTLRNRCAESWSNVDTELKRRHDLVPNLVAAVQGYAKHEKEVLAAVTAARARVLAATGRAELLRGENALAGSLDRLLAVAEAYPRLQASRNFLVLQQELAVTEDRIQAARRFYNANVRDYRDQTRQFPGNLLAGLYKMEPIAFFEVESPRHLATPRVSL
ncbi:MAG: LemA protein [Thermoplasmata archaeon]|jgi:LemA protein|nr:LemA protein [Thermoplasmata archaeon]